MDRSRWRVLIVEDEPDLREIISLVLRGIWECEVVEADDSPEAIRLATQTPFDLVLLDWKLPSATGAEVLRQIKAHPGSANTLLIVISNQGWDKGVCTHCLEEGALACLDKGHIFEDFTNRLNQLLDTPAN